MADATNKTTTVNAIQLDGEVKQDESTVTALIKDESGYLLLASGTSIPGDTTAYTYAKGCQFILTDADTSVSAMYENVGSTTAPKFIPSGGYCVSRTALTSKNIYDLFSYPTTVVEAQGDGSVIIVEDVTIKSDCSAIPFFAADEEEVYLAYGTSTPAGGIPIVGGINSVFTGKSEQRFTHLKADDIFAGTNAIFGTTRIMAATIYDARRTFVSVMNTPVVICATTTGYDDGNATGTAVVTTRYRVIYP